jgi:hypothetical protein
MARLSRFFKILSSSSSPLPPFSSVALQSNSIFAFVTDFSQLAVFSSFSF